jgi:hypothetical protein
MCRVIVMSKDNERRAWTEFVEERERETRRPRARKRAKEGASRAELEAELDDLVTESVLKTSGCADAKR